MSEISLDALIEEGWDVADKDDFGTRDNPIVGDDEEDPAQ
jgi:hypothetical protein